MNIQNRFAGVIAAVLFTASCGAPAPATDGEPPAGADMPGAPANLASLPEGGPEAVAAATETVAVETEAGPMKVMLVMDSSGSMWGQIGGVSKRDIARKAVREMIARNPSLNAAGLMAYGHRRTGDCADIELVRMPGADVPLPDAVDRLSPVGKTPLSAAVVQAADAMNIAEDRATVILVTDGIETCDLDPCATGADLEARGIDFTAHVVGFGLSEQEGRQVACLAEQTGGRYFAAASAAELAEALETVSDSVETGPPEAGTATASISGPDTAEIGATFSVTWTGPGEESDYIDLVPPGYTQTSGELSYGYTKQGKQVSMRAPGKPGDYMLRYVWIAPQGRTVIATTPIKIIDAAVAIIAPASAEIGDTLDISWRGPANKGDYIDLVPRGYTQTSGEISYAYIEQQGEPLKVRVPGKPGDYDLRYVAQASDGRRVLKVVPLEVTDVPADLAFNPDAVVGERLAVDWSGPGSAGDYIDIVPRGYKNTHGELSYAYTENGNPAEITLPGQAGEYDIRYILETPDGRSVLKSLPLTLKEAKFEVSPERATASAGGSIKVRWTGPGGAQDYVDIVPRGYTATSGEVSYAYARSGENPVEVRLPGKPGEYDVRYIFSSATGRLVKASEPLTVTPARVNLDSPASVDAGADFPVSWTGSGSASDYVDLVPAGHTATRGELDYAYVRDSSTLTLTAPENPGDYVVRYMLEAPDGRQVLASSDLKVK